MTADFLEQLRGQSEQWHCELAVGLICAGGCRWLYSNENATGQCEREVICLSAQVGLLEGRRCEGPCQEMEVPISALCEPGIRSPTKLCASSSTDQIAGLARIMRDMNDISHILGLFKFTVAEVTKASEELIHRWPTTQHRIPWPALTARRLLPRLRSRPSLCSGAVVRMNGLLRVQITTIDWQRNNAPSPSSNDTPARPCVHRVSTFFFTSIYHPFAALVGFGHSDRSST